MDMYLGIRARTNGHLVYILMKIFFFLFMGRVRIDSAYKKE